MPIVAFLLSVWQHSPMPSTKAPSVEPENGPICTCRWLPCAWNPSLGQVVARIPVAGCTEHPTFADLLGTGTLPSIPWGQSGADPVGDVLAAIDAMTPAHYKKTS